jgi:hypothetical protein
MKCHGCAEYRPAKLQRFAELDDECLAEITVLVDLREAYRALRTHHIEETTALWNKLISNEANY